MSLDLIINYSIFGKKNVYSPVDGTIFSRTRLPKHRDYVGSGIISLLNCLHRWDVWEQSYSTATGPSDDILIGAF